MLTLIPARDGRAWHRDDGGNYWRTYIFIEKARTYDAVESPQQAFQAAKAFGRFQKLLADLAGAAPARHDPGFSSHAQAVCQPGEGDRRPTGSTAPSWPSRRSSLRCAQSPSPACCSMPDLPERVTHNDTKLNNVMLDDATGEGICVIDLDTVMPGLALYDFGDMVRTTTSPAKEDERDLSKVKMQFPMFEALVRGYLTAAGGVPDPGGTAAPRLLPAS